MCKKVAQLTRVIFFLNTKNDEYESNLKVILKKLILIKKNNNIK
jgi:hypothetical protein